jgi:chromosome segregation ATPase
MPGNPAQLPGFDATHQSDLAALTLANQNEDLQKEIANVRQDQINAQKEAFDLKTQLAEMRKTLESLKSENTRLHTPQPQQISHPPPQMPQQSSMNVVQHERSRSSQQHHNLPSTPQQPSYTPQQYQTSAQHMYQAPSQGTQHSRTHTQHGQPVYGQTGDSRAQAVTQQQPANAWGQGIYGAYQQNQHSGGMLPSTHMMGGYR